MARAMERIVKIISTLERSIDLAIGMVMQCDVKVAGFDEGQNDKNEERHEARETTHTTS